MKFCKKCQTNKELDQFCRDKTAKDGLNFKCKECVIKYYIQNKEKKLKYYKKYRKENKERINEYRRNKYRKDTHISSWRTLLRNTLKRLNKPKEGKTIDILGYSALELKNYISKLFTEGMNWDNYGEWHIDHIKPVISFNENTPVSVVCALSNLQPLWSTTREINGVVYIGNTNKGSKYL